MNFHRIIYRLKKVVCYPYNLIYARLAPVSYARKIGVTIGDNSRIYGSSRLMFSEEPYLVSIGNNVHISVQAVFLCHDGAILPFRKDYPKLDLAAPIVIGDDCFIGAQAIILKGVSIGSRSVVAAGSVVVNDVPAGSIVGGNPAKKICTTEDFLERAKLKSLDIGHLNVNDKHKAYKQIFDIK